MTATNAKSTCWNCKSPIEGDCPCHDLCSLCCQEMTRDLERLDTDSDATGWKG